jgi:hypothetical protein
MARRIQFCGEKMIESGCGIGWTRDEASGWYVTVMFGIEYELEKRRRNVADETYDTGWYLYSHDANSYFVGEWCGSLLLSAVDEASQMIVKADLRGKGYERKET